MKGVGGGGRVHGVGVQGLEGDDIWHFPVTHNPPLPPLQESRKGGVQESRKGEVQGPPVSRNNCGGYVLALLTDSRKMEKPRWWPPVSWKNCGGYVFTLLTDSMKMEKPRWWPPVSRNSRLSSLEGRVRIRTLAKETKNNFTAFIGVRKSSISLVPTP